MLGTEPTKTAKTSATAQGYDDASVENGGSVQLFHGGESQLDRHTRGSMSVPVLPLPEAMMQMATGDQQEKRLALSPDLRLIAEMT